MSDKNYITLKIEQEKFKECLLDFIEYARDESGYTSYYYTVTELINDFMVELEKTNER